MLESSRTISTLFGWDLSVLPCWFHWHCVTFATCHLPLATCHLPPATCHTPRRLSAILAFPVGSLHILRAPRCCCLSMLFAVCCCPNSLNLSIEMCLRLWNTGHWSARATMRRNPSRAVCAPEFGSGARTFGKRLEENMSAKMECSDSGWNGERKTATITKSFSSFGVVGQAVVAAVGRILCCWANCTKSVHGISPRQLVTGNGATGQPLDQARPDQTRAEQTQTVVERETNCDLWPRIRVYLPKFSWRLVLEGCNSGGK